MSREAGHFPTERPLTPTEQAKRDAADAAQRARDREYRLALGVPLDEPLPASLGQIGSRIRARYTPRGKRIA